MPHLVPMPHPTSRGVGKLRRRGRPVPPLLFPSDVHIRALWFAKFPLAPKPQWHWFRHLRATSSGAFIRHQNIPELYEHRRELIIVLGANFPKTQGVQTLGLARRIGHPVRCRGLSVGPCPVRGLGVHEPQGRLLGQCADGELVPHPQDRAGSPSGGELSGRDRRGQHRPNGRFSGLIWPRGSDRIVAPLSATTA